MRRLPALESLTPTPTAIGTTCSIVIAARDEAARIKQTIRRLLAQHGVELEVIVVDDRSTDGTSEILRELAKEDSRLHVKRVDVLPDGWLGKCHACHVGAGAATGDWILFTDADCRLKRRYDCAGSAVGRARGRGAHHAGLRAFLEKRRQNAGLDVLYAGAFPSPAPVPDTAAWKRFGQAVGGTTAATKPFQRRCFPACGKTVETVSRYHCQHHPAEAGC